MILVHEDMLNRYGQKQIETSPITTTMMHKDAEMSNALKCQMQQTDMTDDQKEKLFYANLECYLSLKQQKKQSSSHRAVSTDNSELSDAVIVPNGS